MNTNVLRCIDVKENNVIKEIQLGDTKVKFCNDFLTKEKEEREKRIQTFKQAYINLTKGSDKYD